MQMRQRKTNCCQLLVPILLLGVFGILNLQFGGLVSYGSYSYVRHRDRRCSTCYRHWRFSRHDDRSCLQTTGGYTWNPKSVQFYSYYNNSYYYTYQYAQGAILCRTHTLSLVCVYCGDHASN